MALPLMMRAVVIHRHGGPEVLSFEESPRPDPGPGEVLVRIRATALNRLDIWARSGPPGPVFPWKDPGFPIISGSDGAGDVVEVGPGVDASIVGRRVVIYPALSCGRCDYCLAGEQSQCLDYRIFGEHTAGAMGEYAVIPACNLLTLPDHVPYITAAAMPVAYTTAWRMLTTAGQLQSGRRVLVLGAGGGVGSAAIAIAFQAGALIYAAASSEERRTAAVQNGAIAAVDPDAGPFSDWVMEQTEGRGVDIVVDPLGATWPQSIRSLARGGRLVVCGATAGNRPEFDIRELYQRHRSIHGAPMGNWHEFMSVMSLVCQGRIEPVIDRVFPMSEVADAHRRIEKRVGYGKVVLMFD